MATDYDAPRTSPEDEPANEPLEAARALGTLQVPRTSTTPGTTPLRASTCLGRICPQKN